MRPNAGMLSQFRNSIALANDMTLAEIEDCMTFVEAVEVAWEWTEPDEDLLRRLWKLPTFLSPDGDLLFGWCSLCTRWHTHGAGGMGLQGGGPRVAHCADIDFYQGEPCYFLDVIGTASKEILQDVKRRKPRGPSCWQQ